MLVVEDKISSTVSAMGECLPEMIHGLARNIKESIFIRVNNPILNRNKFNLPHIWDRVLLNTPGLTLKRHVQAVGHANSNTPNLPPNLTYPHTQANLTPHTVFHRFLACS